MHIHEITAELPPDVAAAFDQIGELQRDVPERVMVQAQMIIGGGVLNPVIEHVGDIIHRMTRQGPLMKWGLDEAAIKIQRTYRYMNHPYGFDREFNENIKSNAEYRNISEEGLRQQITVILKKYAEAHAKLPVYNWAQYCAREASVSLGKMMFSTAENYLADLLNMSKDRAIWMKKAIEYQKDTADNLLQFPYPRVRPRQAV